MKSASQALEAQVSVSTFFYTSSLPTTPQNGAADAYPPAQRCKARVTERRRSEIELLDW